MPPLKETTASLPHTHSPTHSHSSSSSAGSASLSPPPEDTSMFLSGQRGFLRRIEDEDDDDDDEEGEGGGEEEGKEGSESEIDQNNEENGIEAEVEMGTESEIEAEVEVEINDEEIQHRLQHDAAAAEEEEQQQYAKANTLSPPTRTLLPSPKKHIAHMPMPMPRTRQQMRALSAARKTNTMHQSTSSTHCEAAADTTPLVKYFAVGADMSTPFMESVCADARILAIGRLDGWMFCVDGGVQGVCCYRNVLPWDVKMEGEGEGEGEQEEEEEEEYNTRGKVVYGVLWEVHESTIYKLLNWEKKEKDAKLDMARVEIMKLECENEFRSFGMGWGLNRKLRAVGVEPDVVVFTGTPGGWGLGDGYNWDVNHGIAEGCMRGIPDEWVNSDVRWWVQYPHPVHPMNLK
ncbi:hypothetical protein SBOR_3120 [Sclerotinia borealis F-4128]|uniref:Uncharacterized protein n=1 Tax=Sclerotinia borealis (strain F-4128) TaxID=1432307 RepID=W9CKH5_SCLBF|nr:hypothetical protein SBOR_3120 [Sclerotinia borealis F-4128]